jgi:hypothetical protein
MKPEEAERKEKKRDRKKEGTERKMLEEEGRDELS